MASDADFLCRACDFRVPLLADLRRHVSSHQDAEHTQLASALSHLDQQRAGGAAEPQRAESRGQRLGKGRNRSRLQRNKRSSAVSAETPSAAAASAAADANVAVQQHSVSEKPVRTSDEGSKGKKRQEKHAANLKQELKELGAVRRLSKAQLNAALEKITKWIEAHFVARKPDFETLQQREDLLVFLRKIISEESTLSQFNLQLFGSVPTSLDSRHSDLDICLVGKTSDPANVLQILSKVIRRHKIGKVLLVLSARVPVVKLTHMETGIECDFTVTSEFRRHQLKNCLLQAYTSLDERFSQLVDAIKYWSKQRYIGDASKGSLNSFGHTLLVLHYCQTCSPPLLPNLQVGDEVENQDVLCDLNPFTSSAIYHDFKKENTQSVGDHLLGFFALFATKFNFRKHYISVRDASMKCLPPVRERQKMLHERQRSMFVVIDPFDAKDNVGRNLTRRVADVIQSEFRRAHTMLLHGCSWDDLTELVEEPSSFSSSYPRRPRGGDRQNPPTRGGAEAGRDGHRRRVFRPTRKQRPPLESGKPHADVTDKDQHKRLEGPPEVSTTV